jgi:tetratricopeptide (TPR) repeat protein
LASGKLDLALERFKSQLNVAREIGDQELQADALWGMGIVCLSQKSPADAVISYNEALRIARSTGNKHNESRILDALSSAVFALGDRAQAITHAQAALKMLESMKDPEADKVRRHLESYRSGAR